jgi:hypothetical protein
MLLTLFMNRFFMSHLVSFIGKLFTAIHAAELTLRTCVVILVSMLLHVSFYLILQVDVITVRAFL